MSNHRTVVITGASSGIGLALVRAYSQRGYNVVGNARSQDGLNEVSRLLGATANFTAVAGDIGAPATATKLIQAAIDRFGQVDVLINNAGIFMSKPFVEFSPDDLEIMLSTNLKGVVYASQAAAAHMIERKQGHIVNISASIAMNPVRAVPAALTALIKGGINHLTRALALELSLYNVKVNAIAPGIIDTPMHDISAHEFLGGLHPLGRMGQVADIADAALYLTQSDFTTGIVLPVDGGATAGKW